MDYSTLQKANQIYQKINDYTRSVDHLAKAIKDTTNSQEEAFEQVRNFLLECRNLGTSAIKKEVFEVISKAAIDHLKARVDELTKEFEAL